MTAKAHSIETQQRRHYVAKWTPAEKAIDAAVEAIEESGLGGANMTHAINLLHIARNLVADVVDAEIEIKKGDEYEVPKFFVKTRTDEARLYYVGSCGQIWSKNPEDACRMTFKEAFDVTRKEGGNVYSDLADEPPL